MAPRRDQIEYVRVHPLENVAVLHPDGGELVDVEEAPVVDLFGRNAPVRRSVGLRRQQPVEAVEAVRSPLLPVEDVHGARNVIAHLG